MARLRRAWADERTSRTAKSITITSTIQPAASASILGSFA
jgi:hypothetical protein